MGGPGTAARCPARCDLSAHRNQWTHAGEGVLTASDRGRTATARERSPTSFDLLGDMQFSLESIRAHHEGGQMAQSAEDVARESIGCYNAGDFDRLRSLLADD